MGWEALAQWGHDVARIERLSGGVANDVWTVRVDAQLAVTRLGVRSDADLAWETELLKHLESAFARLTHHRPRPDWRHKQDRETNKDTHHDSGNRVYFSGA